MTLLWLFVSPASEIEIDYTTDMHGRIDAFLRLAPLLRKNPDAIRIDCGDTLQGTLLSRHSNGQIMIALLNQLAYDIWIPGNHDFEFGADSLIKAAQQFRGKTLAAEFRRAEFQPEAWTLIERKGHKIAVIGMTDPKMAQRLLPDSGWEFESNRDALRKIMPQVLASQPDLIVLAWHSGIYTPQENMFRFLADFPEIDLVLGGHSHEENTGRKIAGAWFVQAGRYAACFAKIRVIFDDDNGKLQRITSELIRPGDNAPIDIKAKLSIRPFEKAYYPYANTLIAKLAQPLQLPEKNDDRTPICKIGAEALKIAAQSDAAMFSVSAMPQFFAPRELTNAGLFTLLPYENELCTVELTKSEFTEMLNELQIANRHGRTVFSFAGVDVRKTKTKWIASDNTPAKLTLAITTYTLTSNPLLRKKMEQKQYKLLHISERDAVGAYLKNRR
ncbi:MAG: metallophosphoesterase [Victivallales bacterium]|nr:metallophosphoesterase [Victivallales bacterium]